MSSVIPSSSLEISTIFRLLLLLWLFCGVSGSSECCGSYCQTKGWLLAFMFADLVIDLFLICFVSYFFVLLVCLFVLAVLLSLLFCFIRTTTD